MLQKGKYENYQEIREFFMQKHDRNNDCIVTTSTHDVIGKVLSVSSDSVIIEGKAGVETIRFDNMLDYC